MGDAEDDRRWHPTCPTCTCNDLLEIVSHHLTMVAERALGVFLGGLLLWWGLT